MPTDYDQQKRLMFTNKIIAILLALENSPISL